MIILKKKIYQGMVHLSSAYACGVKISKERNLNPIIKEFEYGRHTVRIETGKIAKQSTGSVMVYVGGTAVLTTVVGAKTMRPGQDFFPLTVNYQEKTYAAGKIPGAFLGERAVQAKKKL